MAREATVTFEQVSAAAEAIKAQGGKPNSRTVREMLGTGSMATILKHLQQRQAEQSRQSQVFDETLDPVVIKSISIHIADKVQTATMALTIQIAEQQTEMTNLISENERQAAELESLTAAYSALTDQHNQLSGVVQQLETESSRTTADLITERQATESARIQLAKAELRLEAIPRIEKEIEQVRRELFAAQKQAADFKEAAAVAEMRLEVIPHIEKEIEQVRGELSVAQKQAAELKEAAAVANTKLAAVTIQKTEIDTQVVDLKKNLKEVLAQVAIEQDKSKAIAADQAATLAKQVTATHVAETRAVIAEGTAKAQAEQISTLNSIIELNRGAIPIV